MTNRPGSPDISTVSLSTAWRELAEDVLAGRRLTTEEALSILRCPDDDLVDLLAGAFGIRRRRFGKTVRLYFLINAKSGLCPEDCSYCSQSKLSKAKIPRYNVLARDKLLDGARTAHGRGAKTYCIVVSGRSPGEPEMEAVARIVPEIKRRYALRVCASLGMLTPEQARRLKQCGVDRVNHNLNTSRRFYANICSTHRYRDRLDTLAAARQAGLEICCGGIIGMGEQDVDIVQMAFELRDMEVDSIPVNFFTPIDGTPLEGADFLNPRRCLRVLALFRYANPDREIRIAAGRERHLGAMQAMGLYAANAIFVGDYLTTQGQPPQDDYKMIRELGFTIAQ